MEKMATTQSPGGEHPTTHGTCWHVPLAGRLAWTRDVPRTVAQESAWDNNSPGWKSWLEYLRQRKRVLPSALLKQKQSPLTWCLPGEACGREANEAFTLEMVAALHRLSQGKRAPGFDLALEAARWVPPGERSIPEYLRLNWAVESLAWSYALPQLAAKLTPAAWWELAERLLDTAEAALTGLSPLEVDSPRAAALTQQLLAGELPLVLAAVLPEIKPFRRLAKRGRRVIEEGIEHLLDGEGLPAAHLLPWFRPLAASWTRAAMVGRGHSGAQWGKAAREQYALLVEHLLRLRRPDGTAMLAEHEAAADCPALFGAALRTADDLRAWQAAVAANDRSLGLDGPLADALPRKATGYASDEPAAYNSEWAEFGLLRVNWERKSASLAVRYDADHLQAELNAGPRTLLAGTWETRITVAGRTLPAGSGWSCVCWESDDDVDYLELEMSLRDDVRLQRQLLLARRDGFLLIADALLSLKPAELELTSRFPFAPGIGYQSADETREGFLLDAKGKRRALVLPLALPEWQQSPSGGSLETWPAEGAEGEPAAGLQLRMAGHGRGLFSPLFIDLQGSRFRRESFTWRHLTIAQERRILPPDEAAGYRVQIGDEQWLVYRSLATRGSRTVLGLNTNYEFVVGRIDTDECIIDSMLQVE